MANYTVTNDLAILQLVDGGEAYKYRGSIFDSAIVDPANLQHLINVKLIKPTAEATPARATVDSTGALQTTERQAIADAEKQRRRDLGLGELAALSVGAQRPAEPAVGSDPQDIKAVDDMTVSELRGYADLHGIDVPADAKKAELLEAVKTAAGGENATVQVAE